MTFFPEYVGPAAFGIKMGVIGPGTDLERLVVDAVIQCNHDELLDNGDVICITESVLARSQNNYVTLDEIAQEFRAKLNLTESGKVGVIFPIASRNRFSMIMEAIAKAVPRGEVVVQLSWPTDEVGNEVISEEFLAPLGKTLYDIITPAELEGQDFSHPITKVDYIKLYKEAIKAIGAKATVFLANDARAIEGYNCDGIIVADIHTRSKTKAAVDEISSNSMTLVDICSDENQTVWSEWGLLGSNMSAAGKLKLAPRSASAFAELVQQRIMDRIQKRVEVIIYGDGAYKDPTTGIYELADPKPVFGATSGFSGAFREGVKYKYLADIGLTSGRNEHEIEELLLQKQAESYEQNQVETEGTTPRKLEDVIASLADLVSGSADAGTPVIVVKGFFRQ